MKKIILLLVLFCSFTLGQGWNSTVTITSINEPNLEKMDLFTNSAGNHILIKRTNGYIVYYRLDSQGQLETSSNPSPFSTSGDFPNIVGSNERVYALWKEGNNIKGKYSTNGGDNWINLQNRPTTANLCNGVDAIYEEIRGVHLVWATRDSDPYYETYYSRLNTFNQWVDFANVTDYNQDEVGGFPTVSFSTERVHVAYNTGTYSDPHYADGDLKTRDKLNSIWQVPQTAFNHGNLTKVYAFGNNLYDFYTELYLNGFIYVGLHVKSRSLSGTSWPGFDTYLYDDIFSGYIPHPVTTNNGIMHIIYPAYPSLYYLNFNGSAWSAAQSLGYSYGGIPPVISSVSNDLFVVMLSLSAEIQYRQYDVAPLAPQNLAVTKNGNNHPLLTWTTNTEPDISGYNIYKKVTSEMDFQYLATTSSTSYEDPNETYPVPGGPGYTHPIWYYVKAVDIGSHESGASNTVITYVSGSQVEKRSLSGSLTPGEISIDQNYPNPFNPTTKITYSLSEDAKVQIKVYDMLGTEVAELVNETKAAGFYETTFNASHLSSSVYIYRITALDGEKILFSESKRMILMK